MLIHCQLFSRLDEILSMTSQSRMSSRSPSSGPLADINQSHNHTIKQPTNQSINQSTNQSVNCYDILCIKEVGTCVCNLIWCILRWHCLRSSWCMARHHGSSILHSLVPPIHQSRDDSLECTINNLWSQNLPSHAHVDKSVSDNKKREKTIH